MMIVAFDWSEYLVLAKALAGEDVTPTSEAAARSAVSRAYYAAFCHARNWACNRDRFRPNRDRDVHLDLRFHLKGGNNTKVASWLDRLRQLRNQCDYDDEIRGGAQSFVAGAISNADQVLHKLS